MKPYMIKQAVYGILLVVGGVSLLMGAILIALSVVSPDVLRSLGLGAGNIFADLGTDTLGVLATYHIKPLLDVSLLAGSYVLVCLLLWSQERIGIYLANRRHF